MSNYKCLEALTEKYKNYINDESYVYKICDDCTDDTNDTLSVIVIMQKLQDTKTNEDRRYVVDKAHAKFRANKLGVIAIVNINDPNDTKKYVVSKYNQITTRYEVDRIILPDEYDENINNVCSGGIHYFKTLDSAFFYRNVPLDYSGHWIERHENGQKKFKGNYLNHVPNGLWTKWYNNGQKQSEGVYVGDNHTGHWIHWYDNGQKKLEGDFINDNRTGRWIDWHYNGQKKSEGYYVNNNYTGRWIQWYDDGKVKFDHVYGYNGAKYIDTNHLKLLATGIVLLGTIMIGSRFLKK